VQENTSTGAKIEEVNQNIQREVISNIGWWKLRGCCCRGKER